MARSTRIVCAGWCSCGRIDFGALGHATPNAGDSDGDPCRVDECLLGHWTLDAADRAGNAVIDRSGHGRDGVLLGAPLPPTVAARIGEGIDFTGTASFFEIASLPMNTTPGGFNSFSIWFWNGSATVDDGLLAAPQAAGPVAPRYDVWVTTSLGPVAV